MSDKKSKSEDVSFADIRQKLVSNDGPEYWRSLEELAETEEFKKFLHNEFPGLAEGWDGAINRRNLLKLMGASLALAGLSACTQQPAEKIVPYVQAPEDYVPGKPLYFATAMTIAGFARGLLAESHMGRPTKIEGNPQHPASLGATDVFAQASVLELYDPDRSRAVTLNGRISTWAAFISAINKALEEEKLRSGKALRILTETVTSPTLDHQLRDLMEKFPDAKWCQYEATGSNNTRTGARLAYGEDLNTYYHLDKADVILTFDSDLLSYGPACLRYARDWASRRNPELGTQGMNRLYVVESTPTNTGAVADHRLSLRAGEIENIALAVAKEIGLQVESPRDASAHSDWIAAVSADLLAHKGSCIVSAGEFQSPSLHVLAHAMNEHLGNVGNTVIHSAPVEANPIDQIQSLVELTNEIKAGDVDLLVILGGNPVFTSPADIEFGQALPDVKMSIHLSLYQDETSKICDWHVPAAHSLESWGDARAFDGTISIIQPLIAPLYGGKSQHELVSLLSGDSQTTGFDIVSSFWKRGKPLDFEDFWERSLHDGFMVDTALSAKEATLRSDWVSALRPKLSASEATEIVFRPDPCIYDGRFANNGWLQELPKPLTKLAWDNAALISPTMAETLDLQSQDLVELSFRGRSVRAPVWIVPGIPSDSVTVHFGHGRTSAGNVGNGTGFNAFSLRTSDALWSGEGLEILKLNERYTLACTQDHFSMEGRHLVRAGTVDGYSEHPEFAREMAEEPEKELTLYPPWEYSGYKWGMTVNLGSCIGCNACVVACEAENNGPIAGKDEVAYGREMHWLRIDRYYSGNLDNPEAHFQPVLCMQCENAPCEVVCPVAATSHSAEGLNQMIYNRCVGTRYCSNNCPYKVRRFNFLQYTDWETPSLKLMRNPDVTVRGRGVMEKCTYCVQRINQARIEAEKENRKVRDGEIVTACQAACPTKAFTFGDLNDRESSVTKRQEDPLSYSLLGELNTRPRTLYLAKVRNPNPELEKENA